MNQIVPSLESILDSLDFDWTMRCEQGQYTVKDDYGVGTTWCLSAQEAVEALLERRAARHQWLRYFRRRKSTGAVDATPNRARRRV